MTVREALFAGYRPCLRCHPLELSGHPEWLTQILSRLEANPSLRIKDSDLRAAGIEPSRARRYFMTHYGMTFQAFCRATRMSTAFQQIRAGTDLDDVAFENGYESNSGFREAFSQIFGKPPGKTNGADCILVSWLVSPIGPLLAAATSDGICLLEFTERRMLEKQFQILRKVFDFPILPGSNEHLRQLKQELELYFAGKLREFNVPLLYPGSDFQKRVWEQLLRIPFGETRSYIELAGILGDPGAVRAVGHANGLNRIAIVIPCHRVINKNGRLGGYGGGLWRKQYLLKLEQS